MVKKRAELLRRKKVQGLDKCSSSKELCRRLACWKSVSEYDEKEGKWIKKSVYITLTGDVVEKVGLRLPVGLHPVAVNEMPRAIAL